MDQTMPKRTAVAAIVLIVSSPMAYADVEDTLQSRWTGAWLIVNGELHSNCNGTTTDNRINGDLISGRGLRAFPAGELGKVTRVNVRRHRVDINFDLNETVLIEYRDGPFTLYREASCRVELIVDFGEQRTKDLGVEGIEAQFASWFDRYARLADAEQSGNWNQRERRAYPENYEETLADYRLWKVEQHNRLVDDRIAESLEESRQLLAEVRAEDDFGAGLSYGIDAMRKNLGSDCEQLVASSPDTYRQSHDAPSELWANGYEIGQRLAYYIELGRLLGSCYIEPDDLPAETTFSSR
jgi:hypothetical protein